MQQDIKTVLLHVGIFKISFFLIRFLLSFVLSEWRMCFRDMYLSVINLYFLL